MMSGSPITIATLLLPVLACAGLDADPENNTPQEKSSEAARAIATARGLLVAIEGGGAVELDAATGTIRQRYNTGADAFGAVFTPDGARAFITDKAAGTLVEIDPDSSAVIETINVGRSPQQPAITSSGRMYIPLSGDAAIAVVDVSSRPVLLRTIPTGSGSKPHIVSLSPDGATLWATIQGVDPRVIAVPITTSGEGAIRDVRYDLVPRVVHALNDGALYTAHHSTGLHRARLAEGTAYTPYMDLNGEHSEARKQIEGVTANASGNLAAITHEGRRVAIALRIAADGTTEAIAETEELSANPYWVSFDHSEQVMFVSIPGSGTVEAFAVNGGEKLWSSNVGGKPKRMAVRPGNVPATRKVINFGRYELQQGRLNSAGGIRPRAGEKVELRVYLETIAATLCRDYCMALYPQLWVRFDGASAFQEVTGLPQGQYVTRGPQAVWPDSVAKIALDLPANADRIEVYMHFGRITWNGSSCYLAYDMMECPDTSAIDGSWVSNNGRNFRIDVTR